jgi:hypothetical protein
MVEKVTAERLRELLPLLRRDAVPSRDARRVLQSAGLSNDASLRPLLRALAGTVTADKNREVIYDALHALWRLGEPAASFLANARRHADNKWLAYFSILILGRDPSDDEVEPALEEIAAASHDNQIRGAVAEYARSRYLRRRYARFSKLESKVGFVLQHFKGYWNPVLFVEGADLSSHDPETAWLETELRALSREAPETVARLIAEADVSDRCSDPEMLSEWRRHMASLLAPAAGAALLEIDHLQRESGDA